MSCADEMRRTPAFFISMSWNGGAEKWLLISPAPEIMAAAASPCGICTTSRSSRPPLPSPQIFSAAICNRMACTDTFNVVTATRSLSPRSSIFLTSGSRVSRKSGSVDTPPIPRTALGDPAALAHSVTNTVVPALTMSRLPDRRPSFIGPPPGNWRQLTLMSPSPALARCFSSNCFCCTITIGSVPMPNWVAMRSSVTSARAAVINGDSSTAAATTAPWIFAFILSSCFVPETMPGWAPLPGGEACRLFFSRCAKGRRLSGGGALVVPQHLHQLTYRAEIFEVRHARDNSVGGRGGNPALGIGAQLGLDLRARQPVFERTARELAALADLGAVGQLDVDGRLHIPESFVGLDVDQFGGRLADDRIVIALGCELIEREHVILDDDGGGIMRGNQRVELRLVFRQLAVEVEHRRRQADLGTLDVFQLERLF